jgi:hypothetical protein
MRCWINSTLAAVPLVKFDQGEGRPKIQHLRLIFVEKVVLTLPLLSYLI